MHADRCLRYLVATKELGILFDGSKGAQLMAFSDSDWSITHSTTGRAMSSCSPEHQ